MLILEVTSLTAELSWPCSTGTVWPAGEAAAAAVLCLLALGREVLLTPGSWLQASRKAGVYCCGGMRQVVPVSRRRGGWERIAGPRAACLGFHWSWGGASREANMTLKILIEMKRCSQGAHSSAGCAEHSAPPSWADSARCGCTQLRQTAPCHVSRRSLPAVGGRVSIGPTAGLAWSKGARKSKGPASKVDHFDVLHL